MTCQKRLFVFGAGASVHAGYPLASKLWPALANWAKTNFSESHLVRDVVEFMDSAFDLSKSFELLLTDLDDRIERLHATASPTDDERMMKALLVSLRNGLTQMLLSYFDAIRSQPAELYNTFAAKVLKAGDSIITFNYDLALDRELAHTDKWDISDGYGFELDTVPRTKSACTLLKLHGSANWRGELFQGMTGFLQMSFEERSLGQRPIIQASEFEFLGCSGRSDPKAHGANASIHSLIMPTAKKQFYKQTGVGREWEEFWNSLWSQAAAALRSANEVYMIGYSAPEYDTRARNLFATSINENAKLRVCCHDGTLGVSESLKVLSLDARPALQGRRLLENDGLLFTPILSNEKTQKPRTRAKIPVTLAHAIGI
ncbi:MAG: hypothetical protein WBQ89_06320 [Candidatus Acidiferrum sp.]